MLKGKAAIITGTSRGLGKEIARTYVKNGAGVFLCARDENRLKDVCGELEKERTDPDQKVLFVRADISSETDIRNIVQRAVEEFGRIDILVNNAAVQGPIGRMEENDWNLWKETVQTDLFGPAFFIHSVLPIMKKQKKGKIINLSGGGATGPRENYSAYAVAKTGVVRLTETIAREVKKDRIDINAVAPGAMTGTMLEETLQAGAEAVGEAEYAKALERKEKGGASLSEAAELCLFLASEKSDGISGRLISAVWDDWRNFSEQRIETMNHSDIYTLRRIIPQDRGENWDKVR